MSTKKVGLQRACHVKGNWITSSFGESFAIAKEERTVSAKEDPSVQTISRPFSNRQQGVRTAGNDISWLEKYAPRTKDDLAVHKKKVEQVEEWLLSALNPCVANGCGKREAPILLMTGPPGCGKSATVQVLAKDLNFDLQEWDNVQHLSYVPHSNRGDVLDSVFWKGERQADTFSNFMIRASKYKSLLKSSMKKAILVEDFPNVFLQDASLFHIILRKFFACGRVPAIFIISDKSRGDVLEKQLFPKALQEELHIMHISFNAIANGAMGKVLNSITMKENQKRCIVDKVDLNHFVESSNGDIRNAINLLQFSILPDSKKRLKTSHQSKKQPTKTNFYKDVALVLFHALGKVLYCKRKAEIVESELPSHLKSFQRKQLIENPEDIFEKTAVSPDGFNLFLHHNYPDFMPSITETSQAAEFFSQADSIGSHWTEQNSMSTYAVSLAVRGLMFQLDGEEKGTSRKWKSLCKPEWYGRHRKTRENMLSLCNAFPEWRLSFGEEVQTLLLPYMANMKLFAQNSERKALISSLTTFSSWRSYGSQDTCLEEELETDIILPTLRKPITNYKSTHAQDEEENIVIEEFDD